MLQAPAFEPFAATVWDGTVRCFVAALTFWRGWWPLQQGWLGPATVWMAVGLVITVVFERWAIAQGRWAYGPAMPLVFGIGLLPVLQWIIVPVLSLVFVRHQSRRTAA